MFVNGFLGGERAGVAYVVIRESDRSPSREPFTNIYYFLVTFLIAITAKSLNRRTAFIRLLSSNGLPFLRSK